MCSQLHYVWHIDQAHLMFVHYCEHVNCIPMPNTKCKYCTCTIIETTGRDDDVHVLLLFCCSTAPHTQQRRPAMDLANIPAMPANPNFTRNTPARSTYAYGTRRPSPQSFSQQYTPTGGASASQPAPGGGFFKRLIPVRFSKRNRCVLSSCIIHVHMF